MTEPSTATRERRAKNNATSAPPPATRQARDGLKSLTAILHTTADRPQLPQIHAISHAQHHYVSSTLEGEPFDWIADFAARYGDEIDDAIHNLEVTRPFLAHSRELTSAVDAVLAFLDSCDLHLQELAA